MTQELEIYYDPPDISCTTACKEDICEEISSYVTALRQELHKKLLKAERDTKEFYKLQNLCLVIDQIDADNDFLADIKYELENTTETDAEGVLLKGYQQIFDRIYSPSVESESSIIEIKRTTKPVELLVLNSKLSKYFFNIERDIELVNGTDLPLKWKSKKEIYVKNVCYYQMVGNEKIPATLTFFDFIVFSGIYTLAKNLFDNGQQEFIMTLSMIYEVVSGSSFQHKAGFVSSLTTDIIKSIDKMRSTFVEFDWREQAQYMIEKNRFKAGKVQDSARCISVNNVMLNMTVISAKINGCVVTQAYKLIEMPHLHRYENALGQIIKVKKSLLKIPGISNTTDSICVKTYLARRIELLKNPKNKICNDTISIESLFDNCGFDYTNKLERQRKKEMTLKILRHWKDIDYIDDFEDIKKGNKFHGVKIKV